MNSAGRPDSWAWGASAGAAKSARRQRVFVALNPVPSDDHLETAPFEAQYVKLYDVTAPATRPRSRPTQAFRL